MINSVSERATLLKHKVSSWDFNPFDFSHDDLVYCAYLIFEQALVLPGLFQLPISQGVCKRYVCIHVMNLDH